MVRLALANSRMKDFSDIYGLALARSFDGETLRAALAATFSHGQTAIPLSVAAVSPMQLLTSIGSSRS